MLFDELPHRCTIGRVTRANDAMGGSVYGIVIERVDIECWQQGVSANESNDWEKRGITASTKVYFNQDYHLTERHRILITERLGVPTANLDITDVGNPDTLDVVGVSDPDASVGLGVLFRVMCNNQSGNTQ